MEKELMKMGSEDINTFDNIKTRARLQFSRITFDTLCICWEVLEGKTDEELDCLKNRVQKLCESGAQEFVNLVKNSNAGGAVDMLLASPHAVLHADALQLGLGKEPEIRPVEIAELYAMLAETLHDAIPHELKWGATVNTNFEITDPVELINAAVLATSAMDAAHRANKFFLITEQARKRAGKAHAENRAMKEQAENWWRENNHLYSSKDGAAEAIAGKVVPVKFRTARKWLNEWTKKPSASKV